MNNNNNIIIITKIERKGRKAQLKISVIRNHLTKKNE